MIEYFRYALKNIFSAGTRTLLTLISISIGISSVILVNFISETGKNFINNQLDSMGLNGILISSTSEYPVFNEELLEPVRKIEGVKSVLPLMIGKASYSLAKTNFEGYYYGFSDAPSQILDLNVIYGRCFTKSENNALDGEKVCMIDKSIAEDAYKRENIIGKKINMIRNGKSVSYKIIGIVEKSGKMLEAISGGFMPQLVYLPENEAKRSDGNYSMIVADVSGKSDFGGILKELELNLSNNLPDNISVTIETLSNQRSELTKIMSILSIVLTAIGGISLFVSGIGIMTVMSVAVNERKFEIGIKKSIGASNGRIMCDFLIEAIIITIIGTAAGESLAILLIYLSSAIIKSDFFINYGMLVFLFIISMAFGIIFGVYPAYRGAKLRPVDALKTE